MPILIYILLFCLLASAGAILLIASFLLLPPRAREAVTGVLVRYAIGALLGATFLDVLPAALTAAPADGVFAATLGGVVAFFVLEEAVVWHRCHRGGCGEARAAGPLILIGDALHNFVDGVVIAAAFLVAIPAGVTTALAIILHEIFHEAGDLGVLLASGYSPRRAVLFNLLSGLPTFAGALLAYGALRALAPLLPYVLAVAAGGFLYIALAQLLPRLPRHPAPHQAWRHIGWLLLGMGTVALLEWLLA
ncbi:MAG TPA: ZIP family metal transporter [Armatimonadota bacterium]|nr:ZIP family metal transporter [Armatimonadota bacterium]